MTTESQAPAYEPCDVHPEPHHDAIVAALRHADTYSEGTRSVEVVETHRAWVFLTSAHAYKLAKARRTHRHDAASLEQRRVACWHELELNQRLGADAYQGVVPLARRKQGYRVGGHGPVVEWLIAMRRLPRHLMLDTAIAEGTVRLHQIDTLADTLLSFYARAEAAPSTGRDYRQRLLADIASKQATLACPSYGLQSTNLGRLAAELREYVDRPELSIESRATTVVDAHGDLRPEHVCLEPRPVIIDCLEFDRELRLLDPASEIAFLALECRRLGAAWVGARLFSRVAMPLGLETDEPARFYQGYHALVRAAVSIWHLDDPEQREPDRWRARAERYLELGLEQIDRSRGSEPPRLELTHPGSDAMTENGESP